MTLHSRIKRKLAKPTDIRFYDVGPYSSCTVYKFFEYVSDQWCQHSHEVLKNQLIRCLQIMLHLFFAFLKKPIWSFRKQNQFPDYFIKYSRHIFSAFLKNRYGVLEKLWRSAVLGDHCKHQMGSDYEANVHCMNSHGDNTNQMNWKMVTELLNN